MSQAAQAFFDHKKEKSTTDLQNEYLTFQLAQEVLAIHIKNVKEIIEHSECTAIPSVPDFFRGILDLRGRAIPVIDLNVRFNHTPIVVSKRTCIIIVELEIDGQTREMGLMIDAVKEVVELPKSQIEPVPSFGHRINTQFMEGIAKINQKFVVILDLNHVLPTKEIQEIALPHP